MVAGDNVMVGGTDETGVTLFDAPDAAPVPAEFVAVTVKVYAVPLAKPVTMIGLAVPGSVNPPGFEVTV